MPSISILTMVMRNAGRWLSLWDDATMCPCVQRHGVSWRLSLSSVTQLRHSLSTLTLINNSLWWHEIIFIVGRNELTDRSTACHLGCVAGVVGRVIGGGGWEESWCCWLRWKVRTANQSAAQLGPSARLNQSEPSSARPDQLEDHVQCTLFEESN